MRALNSREMSVLRTPPRVAATAAAGFPLCRHCHAPS
eukprot:COSAG01_NODE_39513_length_475_cov_2.018617_2_plen_36_part_01